MGLEFFYLLFILFFFSLNELLWNFTFNCFIISSYRYIFSFSFYNYFFYMFCPMDGGASLWTLLSSLIYPIKYLTMKLLSVIKLSYKHYYISYLSSSLKANIWVNNFYKDSSSIYFIYWFKINYPFSSLRD